MLREKLATTHAAVARAAATLKSNLAPNGVDVRTASLLGAALFCALAPLDISHLLSAVLGAAGYLLLQAMQLPVDRKAKAAAFGPRSPKVGNILVCGTEAQLAVRPRLPQRKQTEFRAPAKLDVWKPSAAPVMAPKFLAAGFEAEVEELLGRIAPTAGGDAAVAHIVRSVKRAIWPILPEAEVAGFASGNLASGAAFGVAVPDVDIVISVAPEALVGRLQGRWGPNRNGSSNIDGNKLQKSAIRACTDRLVGVGAFKFRRSAFRDPEPKVTLLAPAPPGSKTEQGVPVNLSVNAVTPLYAAALLAECGRKDPRAKALILLVRRWAKDRGLSHAAKGHLSPYTWTLLVIYFLQAGLGDTGALLPPLSEFEASSALVRTKRTKVAEKVAPRPWARGAAAAAASVGELFMAFARFYGQDFDWRSEAVSLRLGRRAPPDLALPLHIILHADGQATEVGPSIENPFEEASNLGSVMTAESFARLRSELRRADSLCARGASLSTLLEPWAPPEASAAGLDAEGEEHRDQGE